VCLYVCVQGVVEGQGCSKCHQRRLDMCKVLGPKVINVGVNYKYMRNVMVLFVC